MDICTVNHIDVNVVRNFLLCDKQVMYRVRQKYLTILQLSCECNRWRVEFALERPSSETQSISDAMECWSLGHRAFAVETYLKNNESIVVTQRIFRRHFNIHRNDSVPSRNTVLLWAIEKLHRNGFFSEKETSRKTAFP
jgi:hypothetical protein